MRGAGKWNLNTWCVRPVRRLIWHSYAKSFKGHPQSSMLYVLSISLLGQATFLHSKTSSWHKYHPFTKSAKHRCQRKIWALFWKEHPTPYGKHQYHGLFLSGVTWRCTYNIWSFRWQLFWAIEKRRLRIATSIATSD